ncbi:MAG: porin [Usitatibacter sp.]
MNKKLIALAVAGACVAPAAMAQTANPVTLYGRVHATFEVVEATGGAAGTAEVVRRNRVSDQASLLGVRGTEDLGGGLKAFFQLETAFKPDENNTTFAARNSGVGLQGGWGSLLLGRWDTPFKVTTGAIDPFGDVTLGGFSAAMQGRGLPGANATPGNQFDRRDQNVVQYWSPAWAGVAVRASYAMNEGRTAAVNPQRWSASITYTGGPLYIGYAADELKDNPYPAATVLKKQTGDALFGNFTFGPIKLGALYEQFKRTGYGKQKSWMGNVVWTLGNSQLIYQYQTTKDGQISPPTALGQPECKVNSLGYQYNFSRRTFFLGQYTKVENNAEAACNFGSQDLAIVKGQDLKGISLGLRHIF